MAGLCKCWLALHILLAYHHGKSRSVYAAWLDECDGRTITIMIDKDLLAILCCPETKQPVTVADSHLVDKLNEAVARGGLNNKGKKLVSERMDGGLIRADEKILYPIREGIPVMLIEEGIPLDQVT